MRNHANSSHDETVGDAGRVEEFTDRPLAPTGWGSAPKPSTEEACSENRQGSSGPSCFLREVAGNCGAAWLPLPCMSAAPEQTDLLCFSMVVKEGGGSEKHAAGAIPRQRSLLERPWLAGSSGEAPLRLPKYLPVSRHVQPPMSNNAPT